MSNLNSRTESRLGTDAIGRLSNSKVAVLALGSLGGKVALALAMSGVGQFVLIDPDVLEEHNVPRHVADLRYVGSPKVNILKELISYRNPNAQVQAIEGYAQDHLDSILDADVIVVAGFGSEISQQDLNNRLVEANYPGTVLYAGAYQRAVAGEVLEVTPEGPCYACFSSFLREAATEEANFGADIEYGMEPDEVKAEPGLGIHVDRIANATANWALSVLVNDPDIMQLPRTNAVIVANQDYKFGVDKNGDPIIIRSEGAQWVRFRKLESCLVCNVSTEFDTNTVDDILSSS